MRHIIRLDDYLEATEKALAVFFVFGLVALSFLQVALRLFFHTGVVWIDPLLRHMVLWSGLLGSALAAKNAKHFALDISHKIIPAAGANLFLKITNFFTAAMSGLLFWAAFKFVSEEHSYGSVAFYAGKFAVKAAWAEIIVPLVFLLMAFHFFVAALRWPGEKK